MVSVAEAIQNFLATVDLDELGEAHAAIALTVATKLDACLRSEAASVAMAVPDMSKELRQCLAAISMATLTEKSSFTGLFAPVGDAPHT
jgi:hypothetical protein